jgi:hypothetical protein
VKPAGFVAFQFHTAGCTKQSQKDLFSAFGTLILVRDPRGDSLSCFAKKVSKEGDPTKHEGSCAADKRVGGGRDWFVPRSLAETPPRLFLAPACFKGALKSPMQRVWFSEFFVACG